jgi:hypothetical protein
MKIRIKGNSLRLRLSKTDVARITTVGYLEERTLFGPRTFIYALQRTEEGDGLTADFDGGKITMYVPQDMIVDWEVNDIVTFENTMQVSDSESLHLLLEKDFQCIDQTEEDQADNYVNPSKTC